MPALQAVGYHREGNFQLPACHLCGEEVREGQLQCGICRQHWHRKCAALHHHGPWHCNPCRVQAKAAGIRDVTLDRAVVDYLAIRSLPTDEAEHPRVVKAASKIHCDPRGVLWAHDHTGRPTRRIPPIGERRAIITESMANLLYPSGERLYQHLKERLFWQGMRTECIKYAAAHIAR